MKQVRNEDFHGLGHIYKDKFKEAYAVVLAGGSGTRFWPRSRRKTPKQLCQIGDSDKTMIELTLERLDPVIPPERRIIITHHEQYEMTKNLVKGHCEHIVCEPSAKNTAAALTCLVCAIERAKAFVYLPESLS